MESPDNPHKDEFNHSLNKVVEVGVRLLIILFILWWCYRILEPFVSIVIWGVIISVAVFPMYSSLRKRLNGRQGLSATLIVLMFFVILMIPTFLLAESLIEGILNIREIYQSGNLVIPAPDDRVKNWPIFLKPVADFWTLASQNLQAAVSQFQDEIKEILGKLLKLVAGTGLGILQMLVSIICAGILLRYSDSGSAMMAKVFSRLAGDEGERFFDLAVTTIRSVVKGILGVAVIQSLLAGIGFFVIGVPAAGLWTLFCLILAMMQVGAGPIIVPMIIYVFYSHETGPAVIFLIWSLMVMVSDNVLKPFLLGRGASVPMLVVFLGSIGGFIANGLTGLFLGPVILSMGYVLFNSWLADLRRRKAMEGENPAT